MLLIAVYGSPRMTWSQHTIISTGPASPDKKPANPTPHDIKSGARLQLPSALKMMMMKLSPSLPLGLNISDIITILNSIVPEAVTQTDLTTTKETSHKERSTVNDNSNSHLHILPMQIKKEKKKLLLVMIPLRLQKFRIPILKTYLMTLWQQILQLLIARLQTRDLMRRPQMFHPLIFQFPVHQMLKVQMQMNNQLILPSRMTT